MTPSAEIASSYPPALITAAGALVGALLGGGLTGLSQWLLQRGRIAADVSLANRKFDYERQQAVFKRRFELAEQMLTDAYQFRSMMEYVRNGFSMAGEGSSRKAEEYEADHIKRQRDNYFVPLERIRESDNFIAEMLTRRTVCEAHFGLEAEQAYTSFRQALHQTRVAASLLVEWTRDGAPVDQSTMDKLRRDIWKPMAEFHGDDEIGNLIKEGVGLAEKLCQPVLSWVAKA